MTESYGISYNKIRHDKRLKPLARLIMIDINCLANNNKPCWANNRYFADLFDIETATVSRLIASLKKMGHIRIEDDNGKRLIYPVTHDQKVKGVDQKVIPNDQKVIPPHDQTIIPPMTEKSYPLDQKVIHNTIIEKDNINSINNKGIWDKSPDIEDVIEFNENGDQVDNQKQPAKKRQPADIPNYSQVNEEIKSKMTKYKKEGDPRHVTDEFWEYWNDEREWKGKDGKAGRWRSKVTTWVKRLGDLNTTGKPWGEKPSKKIDVSKLFNNGAY